MVFLTIGEVADRIGVTLQTLRNWDKSGQFTPHHRTRGNQRVYSEEQVEDYLNGNYEEVDRNV